MANIIKPNNREVTFDKDELIVSKTDIKGRITYINRTFMRVSGYSEEQAMGQPHNLIRHPDMPRGAFYLMWKTLQQGEEFFAVVKNLCADGSYYWVMANVTLDYDSNDQVVGYYSVRRPASQAAIQAVIPVYKEMLALEARSSDASAPEASARFLLDLLKQKGVSYRDFILSFLEE